MIVSNVLVKWVDVFYMFSCIFINPLSHSLVHFSPSIIIISHSTIPPLFHYICIIHPLLHYNTCIVSSSSPLYFIYQSISPPLYFIQNQSNILSISLLYFVYQSISHVLSTDYVILFNSFVILFNLLLFIIIDWFGFFFVIFSVYNSMCVLLACARYCYFSFWLFHDS